MATLRSCTDFILHSRTRAIGVAFAITFIPLIGTVSILICGLITLRKGALEGLWILIASTLPYFILLPLQPMPIGLWVVSVITISNVLTWAAAILLNRQCNWNLLLELCALIGIIVVTTAHVVKPDLETWWGKQLSTYITQMLPNNEAHEDHANVTGTVTATASPETAKNNLILNTEPDVISFINNAKPYATGALTASILFTALLQILLSRWWQLLLINPSQLRKELYQIRLGPMAGIVFITAVILSYLKIALAQDMLPVLYLTFCIAGLSLVHYAISKFKSLGWLWLFVFYSILLCSWMVYHIPLAFQLVALTALLDVWVDWRERLDKRFS